MSCAVITQLQELGLEEQQTDLLSPGSGKAQDLFFVQEPSFLFFKILLNFAFMGILGAHLPHLESGWEYQPNPTHFPLAKVENTHPQSKGSEPGAAPQLSKVSSEPGMNRLVKDE